LFDCLLSRYLDISRKIIHYPMGSYMHNRRVKQTICKPIECDIARRNRTVAFPVRAMNRLWRYNEPEQSYAREIRGVYWDRVGRVDDP
jgi:hypothetical protein